jgi:hypothetical protein
MAELPGGRGPSVLRATWDSFEHAYLAGVAEMRAYYLVANCRLLVGGGLAVGGGGGVEERKGEF